MNGKRLKDLRKALKISQGDIAKALNVSPVTISRYETEVMSPSLDIIQRIISVYNINANWLITGEGSMFMGEDEPCRPKRDKPKNEETSEEYRQELERALKEAQDELGRLRERNSKLREENQELNDEIKERFREIIGLQGKLLSKK